MTDGKNSSNENTTKHDNKKLAYKNENINIKEGPLSYLARKLRFKSEHNQDNVFKCYGFYLTLFLATLSSYCVIVICCTNWFDATIQQIITLSNGSFIYELWRDSKVEMIVSYYPFNYTNVDAVIEGKERPMVQELGPYVFRHCISKWNIEFNGVDKLSYSENITNEFLEERSNGRLDDLITTPNLILIGSVALARKVNVLSQIAASSLFKAMKMKPFINVKAEELLFGYNDDKLVIFDRIFTILDQEEMPNTGILGNRDGVLNDRITIGTGIPDINKIGVISEYNDKTVMDVWNEEECNKISSADSYLFPAETIKNGKTVYLYRRMCCRRFPLEFSKDTVSSQGYPVRRYIAPIEAYSFSNNKYKCFCREECLPAGVADISPCYYDIPFFSSNPHFLNGDQSLIDDIGGMVPDPEKHEFYIDIHKSGVCIGGAGRFQIGIIVRKAPYVAHLKGLKEGIALPLGWIEMRGVNLTGTPEVLIYHLTYTAPLIKITLQCILLVISFLLYIKIIIYISRM